MGVLAFDKVESVARMVELVLASHQKLTNVFPHELVLAICWEETFWQNLPQDENGPAVGYGQLEKDGRAIAKRELSGNPAEKDTFPFSREAILAVPEFSMSAVSNCLAGLFRSLKSQRAALNGYAGVKQRPANAVIPQKWLACAQALSSFVMNPFSKTPEEIEAALRLARGFPTSGPKYEKIHNKLFPFEGLVGMITAVLRITTQGLAVWGAQAAFNQLLRSDAASGTSLAPLKVDGVFGSKTLARVQEFQTRNQLVSDGVIGPLTRGKLSDRGRATLVA